MICLYLKILEYVKRLIHKERFWSVHIPLDSMVKF